MPEYIEKKKLLKAIEESEPDVMADYGEYYGSEWGISRGKLYEIIANLPTLTPPNEWVSVEDTVPDPGERVLATDGIFVGEAYRTSADSWHRHTGFPWRDGVTGRTVKYWMLLPAPPAKEE